MKRFIALVALISVPAFASFNEVECTGSYSGKKFRVEVERDRSGGPIFRPAKLIIDGDEEEVYDYSVSIRQPGGFNWIEYSDFGFRLEVDLSPHTYPRFGWSYRGALKSNVLDGSFVRGLKCRFPNA